MTQYNDIAYHYRGTIPLSFKPHIETFASRTLTHFRTETPHVVEVGAGSGSLSKILDRLGNFIITAVDSSPFSLTELTSPNPNIHLVKRDVFEVDFDTPVHAIVSKDYLIAISSLEDYLKHISPSLVHGALFMLTVFADEPGARLAFSGKYGRKWDLISAETWTPTPQETDHDWYSSFIATRRVITYQYSG